MGTTFQSINVGLGLRDFPQEANTPTTPRAPVTNTSSSPPPQPAHSATESAPNTPTRWSFSGINGQRPLPTSPFSSSFPQPQPSTGADQPGPLRRGDSHHSHRSMPSVDSQDIDMDASDREEGGSDGESIDGDGRPTKKKKGQRFFCTDFPPCNLSFTRSEHLARHIRKHTGERPFQCHCSRRFSRLDNLRQHAQTVHVNEEIPGDSLAATGTRFQRQIRTDRVRTPNGRSRASTASSTGSHGRGHSRNLSASSIGSTSSTVSRDDSRRRPPPLMMATDNSRSGLRLDTQPTTPPVYRSHSREPSGDISTPTSSNLSNAPNSPAFGSSYGSPMSAASRTASLWGGRTNTPTTHSRRLSVPSSGNTFQSPQGNSYPPPYLSPLAPSNSSATSSLYGSSTTSTYSFPQGESAAELDWRRRTWHPSTYSGYQRPAPSGLSYYQTPDAPRPAFAPQAAAAMAQPPQRLPGIEAFDQMSKPSTSPARGPSPMQMDGSRPPLYPGHQNHSGPNDRRGHASWDMSLHRNLTKLDIAGTPPKEQPWGQQTIHEQDVAKPQFSPFPQPQAPQVVIHQEQQRPNTNTSFLQPATPNNKKKRMGWYAGPPAVAPQPTIQQRRSPEDSSSSEGVHTPSFSVAEYHPSIMHSNGYVETGNSGTGPAPSHNPFNGNAQASAWPLPAEPLGATPQQHISKDTEMSGLDALVAVATSEEKVPTTGTH